MKKSIIIFFFIIHANQNPLSFLSSQRIDIVVKYMFADALTLNLKTNWQKNIYIEHLKAWNNFTEIVYLKDKKLLPHYECSFPYVEKKCKDDFINSFNKTLHSLKKGFDPSKSIIPIGKNNIPLDGSHRLASAIYFKKNVICKHFDHPGTICTIDLLKKRGLSPDKLDSIIYEYIKLKTNIYTACIFTPCTNLAFAKKVISSIGSIIYEKEINLTKIGTQNFINILYFQDFFEGMLNPFTIEKAKNCFPRPPCKVNLVFFECQNLQQTRVAKDQIRKKMKGYDSIHINDTQEETLKVAQATLNNNSLHFINNTQKLMSMKNFQKLLKKLHTYIDKTNLDKEKICIDTSSILAAYGLRDCADIDVIHHKSIKTKFTPPFIESHNTEAKYHSKNLDDLIFNPRNHFYFEGIKFCTLDILYQMKLKRNEPKDQQDCKLIKQIIRKK